MTKNLNVYNFIDSLRLTHEEQLRLAYHLIEGVAMDKDDKCLDNIAKEIYFKYLSK